MQEFGAVQASTIKILNNIFESSRIQSAAYLSTGKSEKININVGMLQVSR